MYKKLSSEEAKLKYANGGKLWFDDGTYLAQSESGCPCIFFANGDLDHKLALEEGGDYLDTGVFLKNPPYIDASVLIEIRERINKSIKCDVSGEKDPDVLCDIEDIINNALEE